jgi:hypothetical protein
VCVFVYFVVLFVGSVFREEAVGYCILGRYLLVYNLYFISSEGWKYKSIPQMSDIAAFESKVEQQCSLILKTG